MSWKAKILRNCGNMATQEALFNVDGAMHHRKDTMTNVQKSSNITDFKDHSNLIGIFNSHLISSSNYFR